MITPEERQQIDIKQEGFRAAKIGAPANMNPYIAVNAEYRDLWKEGWESGQ